MSRSSRGSGAGLSATSYGRRLLTRAGPTYAPAGAIAETFPRNAFNGTNLATLTSGILRLQAIELFAGQVVSTITWFSGTTALSSGSNQWFCLYSSAREKLAVTNDDTSTAWAASTAKTLTCATPYPVPATGLYYLGVLVVATTVPSLTGFTGVTNLNTIPPILTGVSTTGLTNPASAPSTAAAITVSPLVPYAYCS